MIAHLGQHSDAHMLERARELLMAGTPLRAFSGLTSPRLSIEHSMSPTTIGFSTTDSTCANIPSGEMRTGR